MEVKLILSHTTIHLSLVVMCFFSNVQFCFFGLPMVFRSLRLFDPQKHPFSKLEVIDLQGNQQGAVGRVPPRRWRLCCRHRCAVNVWSGGGVGRGEGRECIFHPWRGTLSKKECYTSIIEEKEVGLVYLDVANWFRVGVIVRFDDSALILVLLISFIIIFCSHIVQACPSTQTNYEAKGPRF